MANPARRYSDKTIKVLFGSSGNQCAYPDCTNPIIAPETEQSDAAVVGHVCHIYAAADNGPRGNPDLKAEERNAPDNLILLCGHHHPIVDKQYETYPADLLRSWKKVHEAKFRQETAEAEKRQAAIQQSAFLQGLSDREIEQETQRLRKARNFAGFPTKEAALAFADRVENTELAAGSSVVRSKALAWCARFLSQGETADRARQLLERSRRLGICEESSLAEAFFMCATDKDQALAMLAPIDSYAAHSASLRIVTNHDKAEGAVNWVQRCKLNLGDFDSEGKFLLLMNELGVGQWQKALEDAQNITEVDFQDTPVLFYAVAMAYLVQAVPEQFRSLVLMQVPFEASVFPLASDAAALHARRQAAAFFSKMSEVAQSFKVTTAANLAADYALWLQLRDPQEDKKGLEVLRSSMRDPAQSLRRVNLALQFGIKLDIASIEMEIDRRVALSGKGSADEAFARFSLAFAQGSPKAVADYIAKHRTQLYQHLQKPAIQTIEIELLARAGQIGEANEKLIVAMAEGLGQREEQHLRHIISESEGADPTYVRRKQFEQTNDLRDLGNLVHLLEEQKLWQELCPYAEVLFERTRSLEDGFRFAKALNESEQYTRLLEFLSQNIELISQSVGLKTMWAWTLYREGRFEDASIILGALIDTRDDENDAALRINLAIASGNWDELVEFTTDEWNQRDKRTAAELLKAGQLAQAVNAPHAKDLVTAAAGKASDDAAILASAYFHAASAGWEQNPTVGNWLRCAAELSREDGPIKFMSMKELVDQKPIWDKRDDSIWQQLNEGTIPVFGAAYLLNRSLINFVLLQSLGNLSESDPRRRSIVYAYSGARPEGQLPKLDTIALDLAALFSLARLGLLGTAIGVYGEIVIPHSTLGWLFQERERVSFHQPSRIKDAHLVRHLIATRVLSVLPTQPPHDPTLVREVGDELAALLITAKTKSESGDGIARFVIRSAPVHRISSLMEEEADLGAYSEYLCSCQAVVTKLRVKGVLTLPEEQQARSYLKLQERSWPGEPTIADGAELYLDNLSVTYLLTIGVLGKFKAAGLTAYVSETTDADANRLISFESLSAQEFDIIEIMRRSLSEGIKSKRVRALRSSESEGDNEVWLHPTFGVLGIDAAVDAFVVDDRSINRHLQMSAHGRQTPILTTLDLLDDLASKGILSQGLLCAHRTYLRQAGFQLIPLTAEELSYHLENAPLANDALVETSELRAIREAMLRARMSKMLQIPAEVPWLHRSMNAIIRTLKQIWQTKSEDAVAYSEWLLELLDVRGWAASAIPGNEGAFALYAYAAHILQIISAPDVCNEVREAYHDWVDNRVVRNIQETEPEIFEWIVEHARELITQSVHTAVAKLEVSLSRQAYIRASLALTATEHYPKRFREALISNVRFGEEFGFIKDAVVSFGKSGISFQRSILFDSVRRSIDSGATDIAVIDIIGDVWRGEFLLEGAPPQIVLVRGEKRLLVTHLALMSPDLDTRLSVFRDEASRVNLPPEAVCTWVALLEARPPDDDEFGVIQDELNDTPVVVRNTIHEQLRSGSTSLDALVPRSVRYYERLVGRYEDGLSFTNYVTLVATPHMERLLKWRTFDGYQHALLLSSQPTLSAALGTLAIQSDELSRICNWLAVEGDIISRTAAVEIGLSRFESNTPLQDSLSRLVSAVAIVEQPQACDRYKLLSLLIIVVYGELAQTRILASKPPFWRRLAAIAQAALIERCLVAVGADTTEFVDRARSARGQLFLLQCYVDLRMEPRWLPELVLPQQLRNEFGGRVWMAANNNTDAVTTAGWGRLLLDDVVGSLRRQINIPLAFLPGPLEGGSEAQMEFPAEHQAEMRADLSVPVITASSFSALVNGSLHFRIPADLADTAADAIARADYRLDCGDDVKVLIPILLGLATVAAITRNHKLTDSLFTLLRKYRRFYPDELGIEDSFRIGMIASASRVEISDWCQCVGNCIIDLAFQPIEQNEAARLHSHLVHLCHLVPELWATCGQAEAALRSVLNI